jgi:DNA modification methylase
MVKLTLIQGDCLKILPKLPDESVDTIITSPPYWGLRDYGEGTNTIWGGDPNCEHEFEIIETRRPNASGGKTDFAKEKFNIKGKENFKEFVDYHNRVTKSSFCVVLGLDSSDSNQHLIYTSIIYYKLQPSLKEC